MHLHLSPMNLPYFHQQTIKQSTYILSETKLQLQVQYQKQPYLIKEGEQMHPNYTN